MLNGHSNQDESAEEKIAEQYNELLARFLDTAATYAELERKEQAGEREQLALQKKLANFAESIEALRSKLTRAERPPVLTIGDLIAGYADATRKRSNVGKTPFPSFNRVLGGGLEANTMITLLGAPGAGKTAMANHIADYVAERGRPVVYVTSEISPHVLFSNTIARLYGINCTAVRKGHADYLGRIKEAFAEYTQHKSVQWLRYIDVTANPYSWAAVEKEAKQHFETGEPGTGLLVVDYLQKLARPYMPNEKDMRMAATGFASLMRDVASRLDCCVIALASQGRVAVRNKTIDYDAILTSAKESGDIEYHSDVVAAVLNPEQQEGAYPGLSGEQRLLVVAKNRLGVSQAQIPLMWTGAHQKFVEIESTPGDDEE